jgi:hypothetical protein
MRSLAVVALALVLVTASLAVLGANLTAAAPVTPADSSACPPSGPVSSGFGPGPYGPGQGLLSIVVGSGPSPAVSPEAAHPPSVTTANVTVSTGDLVIVTAEAINFAEGSYGGPNGSGDPVLAMSDSVGSFYWVGNLSDDIEFDGHWYYDLGPGNYGADENGTWETWVGTAAGSGVDRVTVTLENPAPDTSLGYPGFTTPQVLVTAYPAGYAAVVGGWQDYQNPNFNPTSKTPEANVTTYDQCVDLLAEGFAADGFPDGYSVSSISPDFGKNTNFTPLDEILYQPDYKLLQDGYTGGEGDTRAADGPLAAVETFNSWSSWQSALPTNAVVGFSLSATSVEDGFQLIAIGPDLAPWGLGGSPNGCTSETLSWTNPAPPFDETLVNITVYLYSSTDTLVQAISTDGPSTGTTVTGLICGAQYWFQVQPWFSSGLAGPLSSALSFIAGQFAGTATSSTPPAGFLGLSVDDWAAIGAVAVAGTVVAVALTMRRGGRHGHEIGPRRR